jgi:hypothetical protein
MKKENPNRLIRRNEIESVIKSFTSKKNPEANVFSAKCFQKVKEIMPILLNYSKNL